MRKIIQIATGGDEGYLLVALCDDGTLWNYAFNGQRSDWVELKEIPQDDPA